MLDTKQESNKLAQQLEAVRLKKVKRLKQRITSGRYCVSNQKLARSLVCNK